MGYDYWNGYNELYTSYNHSFYFYQYLDKDLGLRFIYGKRGRDVLPFLLHMRSALQGSPAWTKNLIDNPDLQEYDDGFISGEHDGFAPTVGNAYYFLNNIIQACLKNPLAIWAGD